MLPPSTNRGMLRVLTGALFVDDKAMNIVGANEAGIRGVRFKDARALRTLLIDAGVAIPAVHEK